MGSTAATKRPRQPRLPIETRREQVLDAALALIARRGYVAVSMEAIAREANLSKPVVYNAYPRLGDLLGALLDREERRALGAVLAELPAEPGGDDPRAILERWTRTMVAAIAAHPDTWRLTLIAPEDSPAEVRERVTAGRRFVLGQLRELLEQGLPLGAHRDGFDGELAAEAFLAVGEHVARLLLRDPERYPPERLLAFAELMTAALWAK